MGNIIKFPKRDDKVKSVKKVSLPIFFQNINKSFFQKHAFLSLSVLFLFSVILNISFQARTEKTRGLANFENETDGNNLNNYILKSLSSSDNDMEIVFSKKPSQEDRLIFETLVGSYDVIKENQRITSIKIKPGFNALKSSMLASVLTQYRRALGIDELSFKMIGDQKLNFNHEYKYELLSNNVVIGDMSVSLNQQNEITALSTKFK